MAADRVSPAGTFLSGNVVGSADLDTLPGGNIGRDTLDSNATGTVLSVTTTIGTDRITKISATVNLRADITTGAFVGIFEDTVQIQRRNVLIITSGTDTPIEISVLSLAAAGAHTYEVAVGVSGGGGATVTCVNNGGGNSLGASQLCVDDVGPTYS